MNKKIIYKKAFTLIELLVVISIIGMLSSVILASLTSARDKGRIASMKEFDSYNYHKIGSNIVASYDFDDTTNLGKDTSGNGYNLTNYSNAVSDPQDNPFGSNSLKVISPNSFIDGSLPSINLIGTGAKGITISLWSKKASFAQSNSDVFFDLANVGGKSEKLICQGGDLIFVAPFKSPGYYPFITMQNSSACSNIGVWHNVTLSYNYLGACNGTTGEGLFSVYVDGKIIVKDFCSASLKTAINYLAIGSYQTQVPTGYMPGRIFNGNIDSFKIYGESLTASQIKDIYAEGLKNHGLASAI